MTYECRICKGPAESDRSACVDHDEPDFCDDCAADLFSGVTEEEIREQFKDEPRN